MYIYQDAYSKWFVSIYFILCVIICSFFLLNLTIAVMLKKYEELDKKDHDSKHKKELRAMGNKIGLPETLTEFLIEHDNICLTKSAKRANTIISFKKKIW